MMDDIENTKQKQRKNEQLHRKSVKNRAYMFTEILDQQTNDDNEEESPSDGLSDKDDKEDDEQGDEDEEYSDDELEELSVKNPTKLQQKLTFEVRAQCSKITHTEALTEAMLVEAQVWQFC
jgi:hypothetical protein